MSVYPTQFLAGGVMQVVHDGTDHQGLVALVDIPFGKNIDGSNNFQILEIKCPGCDAVSTHPVGGGAMPAEVQELFTRVYNDFNCPCGVILLGKPLALAKSHAKMHTEQMDGKGRWKLDGIPIV